MAQLPFVLQDVDIADDMQELAGVTGGNLSVSGDELGGGSGRKGGGKRMRYR